LSFCVLNGFMIKPLTPAFPAAMTFAAVRPEVIMTAAQTLQKGLQDESGRFVVLDHKNRQR
jgi:hypothetical protein